MFNEKESIEFGKMMKWANDADNVKKMTISVEMNIIIISIWYKDKSMCQGSGTSLTEAQHALMKSATFIQKTKELLNGK